MKIYHHLPAAVVALAALAVVLMSAGCLQDGTTPQPPAQQTSIPETTTPTTSVGGGETIRPTTMPVDEREGASNDIMACKNAGGEWRQFSDACVDSCESQRREDIACAQVLTSSCDCGEGRCWNGVTCEPIDAAATTAEPTVTTSVMRAAAEVEIIDSEFVPDSIEVSSGDTVMWTNRDGYAHTVTGFGIDRRVPAGGTASHTFTEPGTYDYDCTIHPGMEGTVVVDGGMNDAMNQYAEP